MESIGIEGMNISPGILTEWAKDGMTASAYSAVPVGGVLALALIGKLAYGKISQHLQNAQNHNQRDMRLARQHLTQRCRDLNDCIISAGFAVTMVSVCFAVTAATTGLMGASLIAGVALTTLGAVALNHAVHEHLAAHDGRFLPRFFG